jgi:hypothetical protein
MTDPSSPDDIDYDIVGSLEHEEKYYLALGRFIHNFAEAESTLKAYFSELLEIDTDTANAVFSGMRAKLAMDNIRRLHERYGAKYDPLYDDVREQFGQILAARDSIIHWGARFSEGSDALVTNERYVYAEDKIRSFPISADILEDMTTDLQAIELRLRAAEWRKKMDTKSFTELFGNLDKPAWRYKHAPKPFQPDKKPPNIRTLRGPLGI